MGERTEILPHERASETQSKPLTKAKLLRRLGLFFVASLYVVTLALPLALGPKVVDDSYYPVAGGIVGFLCSSCVLFFYFQNAQYRGPPLALLFWRSVADFCIAIRFIATPGFNQLICGQSTCNWTLYTDDQVAGHSDEQDKCAFASAMFEFFEISSEMWFLCIIYHRHDCAI